MIKNERQYRITKSEAEKFRDSLKGWDSTPPDGIDPVIHAALVEPVIFAQVIGNAVIWPGVETFDVLPKPGRQKNHQKDEAQRQRPLPDIKPHLVRHLGFCNCGIARFIHGLELKVNERAAAR